MLNLSYNLLHFLFYIIRILYNIEDTYQMII